MITIVIDGRRYIHISDYCRINNRAIQIVQKGILSRKKKDKPVDAIKLKSGNWIQEEEVI